MKRMTASAIVNTAIVLGIVFLVGLALWITKNPMVLWGLLGLFFLKEHHVEPTLCPECGYKFVDEVDEEEEGNRNRNSKTK